MMLVMYTFNYLDRYVLTILLEPVKAELGASDTMMGFLVGPAFAILYTTLGIPIARLADRGNRRTIIAAGFALWSMFTAVSGAVRSTAELAVARVGVGIGEAAGAAPAHSLLSDYFPPEQRARALSVFQLGVYAGQMLGLVVGGLLMAPLGWRWTFAAVGLPGLALALLIQTSVREPVRAAFDRAHSASDTPATIPEVLRTLAGLPSFRYLALGTGIASFAGTGYGFWVPTFFIRVHGLTGPEIGFQFGVPSAIAAAVGALAAGTLADRLGQRDVRFWLWVPAAGVTLSLPCLMAVCLAPSAGLSLLAAIPAGLLGGGWAPPCYAATQNLVPPRMRAVAASVLIFFITLLGMGVGPLAVGFVNDLLTPLHGDLAIRWSLVYTLATSLLGAVLLVLGARRLPDDLQR
jgi:MFS family permease